MEILVISIKLGARYAGLMGIKTFTITTMGCIKRRGAGDRKHRPIRMFFQMLKEENNNDLSSDHRDGDLK